MITRRQALAGATALTLAAPGLARAQAQPSRARTLRAVLHADLRVFDPIWTTANITSYHGGMIYDTLFGLDERYQPQPQMVQRHSLSEDRKTYTFELRDGLRFTDGTPVTAADCVASMRRWGARDGAGQHLFARVTDTPVVDDKTFRLVLREPYGLTLDALGKIGPSMCYVMRRREAETDPAQQIREYVGSGPFVLNQTESRPGARTVYDPNPNYRPRSEPPSGIAGGKVVKLDRVIWEHIPDESTALGALQAGEIDFYEVPPQDLLAQLETNADLTVEVLNRTGHLGILRPNFLHAPFDKVEARRALLYLVDQMAIMRAAFGAQSRLIRTCGSLLGCGTTMESDANTDWLRAAPNVARARELFQAAGYDGRPIVVLHATDHYLVNPAAQVLAQSLRQAGINVELAPSDFGGTVQRRSIRRPPNEGGWHIFMTAATGHGMESPIATVIHAANGDRGWFGWPTNARHEELRDAWAAAPDLASRQRVAAQLQENAWNFVPTVYLGQFFRAAARRRNVRGLIGLPEIVPFWNIEKA